MNWQQALLDFFTVFGSLLAFYVFKGYLPKYFEAKGANQATKEDIGAITKIVENIKSDLSQQGELFKAQLSVNSQHRLNIKAAERDALFNFHKCLNAWLYFLVRLSFSEYEIDNYKDIKIISADISKRQYEFDLAEAHLLLFLNDTEFLNLKKNLVVELICFEGDVRILTREFHFAYSKCEMQLEFSKGDYKKQSDIRNELHNTIMKLTDKQQTELLDHYKKIYSLSTQVNDMISERLRKLEDF